jgi:hypothetical protein
MVAPGVAGAAAPKAHAAGGAPPAPAVYSSIVQVRIDRTERAIERATKQIENNLPDKAAINLKVVRRQMAAAWRGARYLVNTVAPPPPAAADSVHAHASGGPVAVPGASPFAGPAETAVRVLSLQHEVIAATLQLIDGAHGTGLDAPSRTLNFALDRRDAALKELAIAFPPAPPAAVADRVRARASLAPNPGAIDGPIQGTLAELDDETQVAVGTSTDATDLTVGGKKLLTKAVATVATTKTFISSTWPPPPPAAG